jgi:hypothetical protein
MSFRESDVTQLLNYLFQKNRELKNQLMIAELVRIAADFYAAVPLYPGIVRACLGKVIQDKPPVAKIVPGVRVILEDDGKVIIGKVKESKEDGLMLEDVSRLETMPSLLVDPTRIRALVNENVLREDWPSLIFEEEKP